MPFNGLRVIAFESRRSAEIAELIRRQQGDPFVASAMREELLEDHEEAFDFAERLFRGGFDMVILMTGVGIRGLAKIVASKYGEDRLPQALRGVTIVARGPKPAAVLREMQVPVTVQVPEPNTWRELLQVIEGRPERKIAVQEYGRSNDGLIAALRERGAEVTPVRVYLYQLPDDTAPLIEAVRRIVRGEADILLFTTSVQAVHLIDIAAGENIEAPMRAKLCGMVIASIGPTTSETLEELRVAVDLEPSHPKMGFLVKETADRAAEILARKRG